MITALLGAAPTLSHRKGDVERFTGGEVVRKSGMWLLEAPIREPAELNAQILELLKRVSSDLAVWQRLALHSSVDMYCGIFMQKGNECLLLGVDTITALAERGIEIVLEIYAPDPEEQLAELAKLRR